MAKQSSVQGGAPMYNNDGNGPICVPGLGGLPLDSSPEDGGYFEQGVNGVTAWRMTAKEVSMLALMNAITDKLDWSSKIQNREILDKWLNELSNMPLMTKETFSWCIDELNDKARIYKETGYIPTLDGQSVCIKSDTLVPPELAEDLKSAALKLMDASEKDWHPHSNDQVLNLVHPSIYPLVYGRSRYLKSGTVNMHATLGTYGTGEELPEPKLRGYANYHSESWSKKFQWLPCEVKFPNKTGTDVRITSYINNLHPTCNTTLYETIERFIGLSIRPWNEVLTVAGRSRLTMRIPEATAVDEATRLYDDTWDLSEADLRKPKFMKKMRKFMSQPDNPEATALFSDDDQARVQFYENWETDRNVSIKDVIEWKEPRITRIKHPEPSDHWTYETYKKKRIPDPPRTILDIENDFRAAGLQVIVKLSSIELTPSSPHYPGGNWHLEGMRNEHIVATSIFYYDVSNVTESHISFRVEAELDELSLSYEQDQHRPLCLLYGTRAMRDEPALQTLGSITTPQSRLLVFPNTLQHRVSSFSLTDPTKPGHRRFLVLWLVDPNFRVLSTANVPPQRRDWFADEVARSGCLDRLPPEVRRMVVDADSAWPVRREEAEKVRVELMAERTAMMHEVETNVDTYNLCEH